MKSVNDNPIDPLGGLGAPIRPAAPKPPETVKPFETGDRTLISDHSKALDTVAETLRKADVGVVIEDGQESDWEGLCLDDYASLQLGCI